MAKRPTQPDHPRATLPAIGREKLLPLAKRVTDATGCPVIGGVAALLHGGGHFTTDIDIRADDLWATHTKLEAAGILWNAATREHVIDGVPVHMVDAALYDGGTAPKRISTVQGVRVVSLADLVAAKLSFGLRDARRAKDLAHVIDLIERVPLTKAFAAKLPAKLRPSFKRLVETVNSKPSGGASGISNQQLRRMYR